MAHNIPRLLFADDPGELKLWADHVYDVMHKSVVSLVLPRGLIVMWSGLLADIPSGWALCDGSNGTPDLRSRFVKGAAAGQDPGATGGSSTHSHTVDSHTHGAGSYAAAGHDHDLVGSHTHLHVVGISPDQTTVVQSGTGVTVAGANHGHPGQNTSNVTSGRTGASGASGVTGSSGAASPGTNSVNHEPSYFALAFIMKL